MEVYTLTVEEEAGKVASSTELHGKQNDHRRWEEVRYLSIGTLYSVNRHPTATTAL